MSKIDLDGGNVTAGWPAGTAQVEMGGFLLPERFWVEMRNADETAEPDLRMEFSVRRGRVECRAVSVTSKEKGREVQRTDLRQVRIDEFMENVVKMVASPIQGKEGATITADWLGSFFDRVDESQLRRDFDRSRRRARVTPERLREVASLCRESSTTNAAIEEIIEILNVERRAAQLWIKRAREMADPETGEPYLEGRTDGK